MSCVTRVIPNHTRLSIYLSIHRRPGRQGGAPHDTPRLLRSILVNRERVGERGTAGGRGLDRPFDFERAYAHSNGVLYQVSPPVTLMHTLPLLSPPRCLYAVSLQRCALPQGDCDAGERELAAALGWQHELVVLGRGQCCTVLHHGAVTKENK
eukprot:scaffold106194_cov68-Phaeocystis_antarctica.AAC.2